MQTLYFDIEEFCITDEPLPVSVAGKLSRYHIWVLNPVRIAYRAQIIVSRKSGYRPYEYELAHNRKGDSEHCFFGLGAVDITGHDLPLLLHMIATITQYCRITYYPLKGFFHLDYKGGVRRYYIDYSDGLGWKSVKNLQELSLLVSANTINKKR